VAIASVSAADFNFSLLPTYASDSSAGAGGLATGRLYKLQAERSELNYRAIFYSSDLLENYMS